MLSSRFSALLTLVWATTFNLPAEGAPMRRANSNSTLSAYYPGYNANLLPPEQIPWELYDHLDYFVATTGSESDQDLVIENEENLKAVVSGAKAHKVTISLSVGGWTGSKYFSSLVANENNREKFAQTMLKTVKKYGFDGIDIDWEYPNVPGQDGNILSKDDAANLLKFLKVLRKTLGSKARLSAAVSVHGFMGPDGSYLNDHKAYSEVLDFITIMAYDLYSPSSTDLTGPNAPLFDTCNDPQTKFSVNQSVETWTSTNFNPAKILLGVPAYGYQYTLPESDLKASHFAADRNLSSLLFTKFDKAAKPSTTSVKGAGATSCGGLSEGSEWLFKDLIKCGMLSADGTKGLAGFTRHYDKCSKTPFLFNPSTKALIAYDDARSLARKASFAKSKGLAGINIFDATGDTQDHLLVNAIKANL